MRTSLSFTRDNQEARAFEQRALEDIRSDGGLDRYYPPHVFMYFHLQSAYIHKQDELSTDKLTIFFLLSAFEEPWIEIAIRGSNGRYYHAGSIPVQIGDQFVGIEEFSAAIECEYRNDLRIITTNSGKGRDTWVYDTESHFFKKDKSGKLLTVERSNKELISEIVFARYLEHEGRDFEQKAFDDVVKQIDEDIDISLVSVHARCLKIDNQCMIPEELAVLFSVPQEAGGSSPGSSVYIALPGRFFATEEKSGSPYVFSGRLNLVRNEILFEGDGSESGARFTDFVTFYEGRAEASYSYVGGSYEKVG